MCKETAQKNDSPAGQHPVTADQPAARWCDHKLCDGVRKVVFFNQTTEFPTKLTTCWGRSQNFDKKEGNFEILHLCDVIPMVE